MNSPTEKRTRMRLQHLVPRVMQMRAENRTLQEIGAELQLSKQRIHQVVRDAKRMEEIQSEWGWPFSARAYGVLKRLAVKNKDQARRLYETGHIHPNTVTGFGWKTYHEICEWLEVPMIKRQPEAPTVCPHCGRQV